MTSRECCKRMVEEGRAVAIGDIIKVYNRNGTESVCRMVHNKRVYWKVYLDKKTRLLPIANLTWICHGNKLIEGKTVDHIDRNSLNNSITNLRLATPAEQTANRHNSKTNPELRAWMRVQYVLGKRTIRGMAREFNICKESISDIIHMRYKHDKQLLTRKVG